MRAGFITDRAFAAVSPSKWDDGQSAADAYWVEGSMEDRSMMPLGTYRCKSCHKVEFYADPEAAESGLGE